ncbi:MAG: AmmeMemoRadiSam system protein B [Planctomycetes bacterium]|nr:AmmeMemoRadiSam system protein B [Planctomycetota bacterium]
MCHPQIRPLELVPLSDDREGEYALRDPYSFSSTVALPFEAAMLVTMMDGKRSLKELHQAFHEQFSGTLTLSEIEQVVNQLDTGCFLENDHFEQHKRSVIAEYETLDIRPAAHAGTAYPQEEGAVREQLGEFFTCQEGPGLLPSEGCPASEYAAEATRRLCGVMSPHIDFHRGGPTFAWAYDRVVTESTAKVFVILGTAHTPLESLFSVSRKHFDTPLGTVETDRDFIEAFSRRLSLRPTAGETAIMFDDEFPHRQEHSIEFQALMLQYILGGRRDYQIVPIWLVPSVCAEQSFAGRRSCGGRFCSGAARNDRRLQP